MTEGLGNGLSDGCWPLVVLFSFHGLVFVVFVLCIKLKQRALHSIPLTSFNLKQKNKNKTTKE